MLLLQGLCAWRRVIQPPTTSVSRQNLICPLPRTHNGSVPCIGWQPRAEAWQPTAQTKPCPILRNTSELLSLLLQTLCLAQGRPAPCSTSFSRHSCVSQWERALARMATKGPGLVAACPDNRCPPLQTPTEPGCRILTGRCPLQSRCPHRIQTTPSLLTFRNMGMVSKSCQLCINTYPDIDWQE